MSAPRPSVLRERIRAYAGAVVRPLEFSRPAAAEGVRPAMPGW
jgi:hypothetical protein